MKKVLGQIWWFPLLVYMVFMPSFMSEKVYKENCKEIKISIIDSQTCGFVTGGMLLTVLQDSDLEILGTGLNSIDLENIENKLFSVRELKSVEVYKTADGIVHIDADQRDPLIRVITGYGNNYYIDGEGEVIPYSRSYTPRLPVLSGNIEIPDSCIMGKSILLLDDGTAIKKAFYLVKYIMNDEFWKRQVEQIWINGKGEYEIVPRVGDHIIKFGYPDSYEWKLKVLGTFYRETLAEAGWDLYDEIDIRFKGQLICRRN